MRGRNAAFALAVWSRQFYPADGWLDALQLIDTTVELANKVGVTDIIARVVDDLKDESEPYRKMVMETIEKIVANLGAADIDQRLEERMMDGMLFAFQEQTTDDSVMLNGMRWLFVDALIEQCV